MAELSAPPSIGDLRTQAYLQLIARLGELDLVPLLVYRIDSVPESALPFLAWQFDLVSPFWQLFAPVSEGVDALTNIDLLIDIDNLIEGIGATPPIATELSQRDLLKIGISLHRLRGTPFALKQALGSLGWTDVDLLEGQASWGGNEYPTSQGWAVFRAVINLREGQEVDSSATITASAAIDFFKNARSKLDSLWFTIPPMLDDAPIPTDSLTLDGIAENQLDAGPASVDGALALIIAGLDFEDRIGPIIPLHDSHYRYGGITHGANEPIVANSALMLNGVAVLHGG